MRVRVSIIIDKITPISQSLFGLYALYVTRLRLISNELVIAYNY